MDSRWFKEDRRLPNKEQKEAKGKTEEALKNSTLIVRLLTSILEDEIESTYLVEENFEHPAYNRLIIASASRRKTLKDIIKLLP